MTIHAQTELQSYFRERLLASLGRHEVRIEDTTEWYLVQLLAGYAERADRGFGRPFVFALAEALEAADVTERLRLFRDLGDSALYACGFFSDHLSKRGVTKEYAVTMGARAYSNAEDLAAQSFFGADMPFADVYGELAEQFEPLTRVFDEIRESTTLRTPQDIIRLYDRWRKTGSPLLAERLREQGVYPQTSTGRGGPSLH